MRDVAAHNAEVKEVWDAYHRGEPLRVPIVFGINPRYTMLRPDANPDGITFEEMFTDPDKMLQRQLEHEHWILHHLPQDRAMGLPAQGWHVTPSFQNTYEAAWFGCPWVFHGDMVPDTLPILADEDSKRKLFDQGLPDPYEDGSMKKMWEFREVFLQRQAEGYEFSGRPIAGVGVAAMGTDGPVTTACNLRGATEFFCDLLLDPDYAQELLAYVTEATIQRIQAYRKQLGHALTTPGWGYADDSVALLSVEVFRDCVMPHHRKLLETFSEGGPNSIHLCGDATHLFCTLRDELNIRSFDTGFPIDHGALRDLLGDDIQIQGGPSVPFLVEATPEEVRSEVRRILSSGVTRGGKFILREGNNLAPEVPLENAVMLYEAGREFGRY